MMPVQIGDHFLFVKELARNHHVVWTEDSNGNIVSDRWLDHKPDSKELSELALEMGKETMPSSHRKNPQVRIKISEIQNDPHWDWHIEVKYGSRVFIEKVSGGRALAERIARSLAEKIVEVKRNPNVHKVMTYGTIPPFVDFEKAFEKATKSHGYSFSIRNSRFDLVPDGDYNDTELYDLLHKLVEEYGEGNDEAGDWASNIIQSVGFEWV